MKNYGYVRITSIILENFKNVRYGKVGISQRASNSTANILGIYGQNGSGKTALIDAIAILGDILKGKPLKSKAMDYINVESDYARLQFSFEIKMRQEIWNAIYDFKIRKQLVQNTEDEFKPEIYDEKLKTSFSNDTDNYRQAYVMDTEDFKIFGPELKYRQFVGKDVDKEIALTVERMMAQKESRSFIFSDTTGKLLQRDDEDILSLDFPEYSVYMRLLSRLRYFGEAELFIIDTRSSSLISMDALPLTVKYDMRDKHIYGRLIIRMNGPEEVRYDLMPILILLKDNLNLVLSEIIPGLSIEIKEYGLSTAENGDEMMRFELMSSRNGKTIPLRYESEGIKKIISILQLLIMVYNTAAITVVIDELDSGIFEYLLGELLMILSEEAEGQLIFTSHNLRPLETMNKENLVFSTANPENRYIRMENVQANNNLRDKFFRDIQMNNQKEPIYEGTSNIRISGAFIDAGEAYEL